VTGINDDGIQKKLLAEPTLTYRRALEIAQGCALGRSREKLEFGFVVQHMPSVLGVVGKGSPSCPGKKERKREKFERNEGTPT